MVKPVEQDSPFFSLRLQRLKGRFNNLTNNMTELVKIGEEYCKAADVFADHIEELAETIRKLEEIGEITDLVADGFLEVSSFQKTLTTQLRDLLVAPRAFLQEDVVQVRDMERTFIASKSTLKETEFRVKTLKRAEPTLEICEAKYNIALHQHTLVRFDFLSLLQGTYGRQRALMMQELAAVHYAHLSFFKQAHSHLSLMEPLWLSVHSLIREENKMLEQHTNDTRDTRIDLRLSPALSPFPENPPAYDMKGYLFAFAKKAWRHRWVIIDGGKMFIQKADPRSAGRNLIPPMPLILCTVREGRVDSANVFEMVNTERTVMLKAPTATIKKVWMDCIQRNIENLLNNCSPQTVAIARGEYAASNGNNGPCASTNGQKPIEESAASQTNNFSVSTLTSVAGNSHCADCRTARPEWASINLGVLICIECSGIHRSLGTHITKVRSTRLDTQNWEPVLVYMMSRIGNNQSNKLWERTLHADAKPLPNSTREEKTSFIQLKYVHRRYVAPQGNEADTETPADKMMRASKNLDLLALVEAYALGCDVNFLSSEFDQRSALHLLCSYKSVANAEAGETMTDISRRKFVIGWTEALANDMVDGLHNSNVVNSDDEDDDDDGSDDEPLLPEENTKNRFEFCSYFFLLHFFYLFFLFNSIFYLLLHFFRNSGRRSTITVSTSNPNWGQLACIQFLVLNGADVNLRDGLKNWTPLAWGVSVDNTEIVRFLLSNRAKISKSDVEGSSLLELAGQLNASKCSSLLQIGMANEMARNNAGSPPPRSSPSPPDPKVEPLQPPSTSILKKGFFKK
jgi:Arf-GAP/coiled-coil/ANK repeat/PH domain-containing protein